MNSQIDVSEVADAQETDPIVDSLDAESPSIIRLLDVLVGEAVGLGIPRVRIKPREESASVHFEVDGKFIERVDLPRRVYEALLVRLKRLDSTDLDSMLFEQHVFSVEFHESDFGDTVGLTIKCR